MDNTSLRHCLVTGGSGFIGQALCGRLDQAGWRLTVLTRNPARSAANLPPHAVLVTSLEDVDLQQPVDAVINLAGEPIAAARWSAARKAKLHDSRTGVTRALVELIRRMNNRPQVLVSGSAIGWYGDGGDRILTEADPPACDEYTHHLCASWEDAAETASTLGLRTCLLRTGLVIAPGGGFLARMLLPFRLGLGGPIGNGRQWLSWIHRDDLVGIIMSLLDDEAATGVFNGTAPNPVTSREFATVLGGVLHRPAVLPLPAPALRLALGEMSRLLLTGQRVLPRRMLDAGYVFRYPDLELALRDAVS